MKIQYKDQNLIIFESDLFRTTSSIIKGKDYILVVDPNWLPREVDLIKKKADKIGRGKEKYLLFTHSDYDHMGITFNLQKLFAKYKYPIGMLNIHKENVKLSRKENSK